MKKGEAKERYVADFLALPPADRQTEAQAAAFAMKNKNRYSFKASGGSDPYQHIKGWLLPHIGRAI